MTANCDIVMAVWNQLEFTKDCVESIVRNTQDVDYRIIIIDNASSKETADYLNELAGLDKERIMLIHNETNMGFLKAANQGMNASKAPYVCLLNNDTVVTSGWLAEMIRVAQADPDIGLINPSSNNLGQRPAKGEPIESFAERRRTDRGKFIELGAAIGFCMLIKREVIEKVGVFDEVYGMGNFEDTDYSRRAVKAGYRCVMACGAYVYHRENSSFSKVKTFNADFEHNREIFEFRWGKPKRIAYVLDHPDSNAMKRISTESIELARGGNRVWFFFKDLVNLPEHGNILRVSIDSRHFYRNTIFNILKKKKKFAEIFVDEPRVGRILETLKFIHKAQVKYY